MSLKATSIRLEAQWYDVVGQGGADFHIKFARVEVKKCLSVDEKQKMAGVQMEDMCNQFDINIGGGVTSDRYVDAKEKERTVKKRTLRMAETEPEREEMIES